MSGWPLATHMETMNGATRNPGLSAALFSEQGFKEEAKLKSERGPLQEKTQQPAIFLKKTRMCVKQECVTVTETAMVSLLQ